MEQTIREIAVWALPVLIAIIFHEVAHGWVAYRLGDSTAARMGRLTLNPIAHIDHGCGGILLSQGSSLLNPGGRVEVPLQEVFDVGLLGFPFPTFRQI